MKARIKYKPIFLPVVFTRREIPILSQSLQT
jgi:hypothetical protein